VVAADGAALATAVAPEWIVCKASARSVVDGVVVCPLGIFSSWAHCLPCQFLEGADGDRERTCSVEPGAVLAEDQLEPPTGSWAELIIELL
jgi:hypothetical protein